MNDGKFSRKAKAKFHGRQMLVLVSVIFVIALAAGATLAYLSTKSGAVTNTFNPSQVTSKVYEPTFNGESKSNVPIKNTSDVTAYIRAEIVATWMAENGDVLHKKPVLTEDYTMTIGSSWEEKDGFYYHKTPVVKDGQTGNLIVSAAPVAEKNPQTVDGEDYYLSLEIICSAIQADGVDAKGNKPIELAWGVDISNGNVIEATISK